jgi:hypothetical protein
MVIEGAIRARLDAGVSGTHIGSNLQLRNVYFLTQCETLSNVRVLLIGSGPVEQTFYFIFTIHADFHNLQLTDYVVKTRISTYKKSLHIPSQGKSLVIFIHCSCCWLKCNQDFRVRPVRVHTLF